MKNCPQNGRCNQAKIVCFHVFIFLFRIVSFNNKLKVITINWHQYNATEME